MECASNFLAAETAATKIDGEAGGVVETAAQDISEVASVANRRVSALGGNGHTRLEGLKSVGAIAEPIWAGPRGSSPLQFPFP